MGTKTTLDDLLDLALEQERRTGEAYRRARALAPGPAARAFLDDLAREEADHCARLERLRHSEGFRGKTELAGGAMLAVRQAADAGYLVELDTMHTLEDVLLVALKREHLSRVLFRQLAAHADCEGVRALFGQLAAAEDEHYATILARFNDVRRDFATSA